jgi:hypothetical protein
MRNLALYLVFCSLAASIAGSANQQSQAQNYSLVLKDESAADSPIKASGQVKVHRESSEGTETGSIAFDVQLQNVSQKPILAYQITIDVIPELGRSIHHTLLADLFFKKDLLPGEEDGYQNSLPALSYQTESPSGTTNPRTTGASFNVVFVEFADGTSYGKKSSWGNALPNARTAAIEQMKASVQAFETSGEPRLRATLSAALARADLPNQTKDVLQSVKLTLDEKGLDAALSRLNNFLSAAAKRNGVM